jgi:hypothetical protein
MELTNEFEVAVPVSEAWAVLTDVERIAPCLPGAELKEIEGAEYRGVVKVKVGPITASYRGVAHFDELDESTHRAVLKAEGRETRGQGNASATITATLAPSETGTKVQVATELAITGKVAQFGRGVLADVSSKLLDQFVQNLETMVLSPKADEADSHADEPDASAEHASGSNSTPASDEPASDEPASDEPASDEPASDGPASPDESAVESEPSKPVVRTIESAPAEPVDLVGVAGRSVAKRLIPFASIAGALFLARIVVYALRRRKK